MNSLTSPGSLVTVAGAILTVIGSVAYATDSPSLSLAGVFYGIPIFLGGLALKSSEIPPAIRLTNSTKYRLLRDSSSAKELSDLLNDVTRWKYGQKAHLESSLEALKLWNQDAPPQLLEVEEFDRDGCYGLRLRFLLEGVSAERWHERIERIGRFFGARIVAEINESDKGLLDLILLSNQEKKQIS
uniref:Acclimation of photosynthesis to environment protein n=1 Tax=Paulinella chromatophora TaxID=39717 RepID=B1X5R9_PAUCH|nr:hypothetical protein PCC_0879 [Paulinella chromatophora]ACB43288.1 hypothetical protein PCC_0879 [Paulinella chromatophora]